LESAFGFIKVLREQAPMVVMLDVGLASMNGTKLVELGRQHAPRGSAIILYSGRDDKDLEQDVLESGANGFIHKRTTDHALVRAVRGFMNQKRGRAP
jgi:DNA-binding NarL/FixJ family response regulator